MKKIIAILFFLSSTAFTIGCTNTEVGTATGAAAGAGLGYAVSGDAGGALIGGAAGALIGNQIGREQDRRYRYYYY